MKTKYRKIISLLFATIILLLSSCGNPTGINKVDVINGNPKNATYTYSISMTSDYQTYESGTITITPYYTYGFYDRHVVEIVNTSITFKDDYFESTTLNDWGNATGNDCLVSSRGEILGYQISGLSIDGGIAKQQQNFHFSGDEVTK